MQKKEIDITDEQIIESVKDVIDGLKTALIIFKNLKTVFLNLTDGLDFDDINTSIEKSKDAFNRFYSNMLHGALDERLKESIVYILNYFLLSKENKDGFLKCVLETVGIVTPITKRKITKSYIINDEISTLDKEEQNKQYVNNILELFDCYLEIINYDKYVSINDINNKAIATRVSKKICLIIYDLLCFEIRKRKYCSNCLDNLTNVLNAYNSKNNVTIKDIDGFKKALNENVFLEYEDADILYGDLLLDFINNKINKKSNKKEIDINVDKSLKSNYNKAKKFMKKLVLKLKQNGVDNAKDMLYDVKMLLDRKINKNEAETFYQILDYLLEKEADESYYNDSYNYYWAINNLSAACTIGLYERKIYVDSEKTKEIISKLG